MSMRLIKAILWQFKVRIPLFDNEYHLDLGKKVNIFSMQMKFWAGMTFQKYQFI